ncbi:MAG TPA: hypothetical protein VHX17_13955 [Candidatus Cybelea sp.]|jgi:hypothetical protein|nr:hypothetical protein [Candidatus Cybelea sp.]
MQVRANALMHYIDTVTNQQIVEATTPPAPTTCGVCCDVVNGMPTNWRCTQCTCTGTCTLQSQTVSGVTTYYCTCS